MHRDLTLCRIACTTIALLVLGTHATAFAQGADPAALRAKNLITQLKAERGGVLGLGPAAELEEYLQWLPKPDADALLGSALKARPHPLAKVILERERARQALQRGDREAAQAIIKGQGFATDWQVIGPFANEGMSGLDVVYPPEEQLQLDQSVQSRIGTSSWQRMQEMDHIGWIDLDTLVRPIDNAVVYGATIVRNPRDQNVVFRVAATAAYTLWIDGGKLATLPEAPGGEFDRDAYEVRLSKGDHLVLIKLANETDDVGFSLRLTDAKGSPLKGMTATANPDVMRNLLPKTPGEGPMFTQTTIPGAKELQPPLLEHLEAARAIQENQSQKRAMALARTALLAHIYRPDDRDEPVLEFIRQARDEAAGPEVLQLVSGLYSQQWQRKEAIDLAWKQAQRDPWIGFKRSQIAYSATGDASRIEAGKMISGLIQKHPGFIAARLLEIEILADEELTQTAWNKAKTLVEQAPKHALVLQTALAVSASLPVATERLELYAQKLAIDAANIGTYGPYAALLLQADKHEDARAVVQKALKTRPDIVGFYSLNADIERASGKADQAMKNLQTLTELVPGDANYWSQLGMAQAELGLREAAVASLGRSLEIEPQNTSLKEYLDYLAPQAPGLDETYALEVKPLAKEEEQARFASEDYYYLLDQKITQVYPNGLSSTFYQRAITVRTDQGVGAMRSIYIPYTPGDEVVDVRQIRVTRPDGSVRETYQRHEESMSEPWYNLYYDYRALVLTFPDLAPGDTIEVRYALNQTASTNIFGDYFGDLWFVQDTVPKLHARYVLLTPKSRGIEVHAPKLAAQHSKDEVETSDGVLTARVWSFKDVPGIKPEPGAPGFSELAAYMHVSTYKTWDEIAKWYWNLIEDQLVVDSELRKIVKDLVKDVKSDRAKVSAIHNYVVKNTRYVALEFGIHGYKPYRTTLCHRRRFGDCKDKASLLKVMLEEAGIKADIVLTRTRNGGAIKDDPASLKIFDHAITYVPAFKLFLDGTAEYSGTDELPWGDQGVQVLIVENGGGYTFTRTPIDEASKNTLMTSMEVDLTGLLKGTGSKAKARSTVTGQFAAGYRRQFQTKESRNEAFAQSLAADFPGASVSNVTFSDLDQLEKPVEIQYDFAGARLGQRETSSISFLPAMRLGNLTQRLASRTNRTFDLILGYPYTDTETYEVILPPAYNAKLPAPTKLDSPFGRFSLSATQKDNRVSVKMELAITTHRVKASDYPAFRRWLEAIDKALQTSISASK